MLGSEEDSETKSEGMKDWGEREPQVIFLRKAFAPKRELALRKVEGSDPGSIAREVRKHQERGREGKV